MIDKYEFHMAVVRTMASALVIILALKELL